MPDKHLMYAVLVSILFYLLGMGLFPIFILIVSSLIIDIDHIFDYMFKFKNYNWDSARGYLKRGEALRHSNKPLPVFIFHNIETLFVLLIMYMSYPIFIFIFSGIYIHLILDWKVMQTNKHPFIIKFSLILTLIENYRREKGRGKW